MKKNYSQFFLSVLFCIMVLVLSSSCSTNQLENNDKTVNVLMPRYQSHLENAEDLIRVNSILIAPIGINKNLVDASFTPSQAEKMVLMISKEEADIDFFLASSLIPNLDSQKNINELLRKIAIQKKIDGILQVEIVSFKNRAGTKIGSEAGSHISINFSLVKSETGGVIWKSSYNHTEEAVTENLLKVGDRIRNKEGLKWQSSEELFEKAVRDAILDLNEKRLTLFYVSDAAASKKVQ